MYSLVGVDVVKDSGHREKKGLDGDLGCEEDDESVSVRMELCTEAHETVLMYQYV